VIWDIEDVEEQEDDFDEPRAPKKNPAPTKPILNDDDDDLFAELPTLEEKRAQARLPRNEDEELEEAPLTPRASASPRRASDDPRSSAGRPNSKLLEIALSDSDSFDLLEITDSQRPDAEARNELLEDVFDVGSDEGGQ
jgi:hypothetical protein